MARNFFEKRFGPAENIICWLVGGHYGTPPSVWGISYNSGTIKSKIETTHIENPVAKNAGVRILGITEQGPDDILVHESYECVYLQTENPAFAIYVCSQDKETYQSWINNLQQNVQKFIREKGYDLTQEEMEA